MAPVIIGIVPKPKINMYNAPENMFPVEIEPIIAIYTNPHGKKPLKKPMENSALSDFLFKYNPRFFLTFPIIL